MDGLGGPRASPLDPLTADQRQELLRVAKVPVVNASIASPSADAATGAMLEWAAALERSG
ncbi:MAG TPA: hypothetical protein VMU63_08910 [Acidimicrobiales bacterium]|nr:hypothetical protein [Acidimicrobiales bacterium]